MIIDNIKSKFPGSIVGTGALVDKPMLIIKKEDILKVCEYAHELGFDHLSLITGVDYQDHFEVIYNLWSYSNKQDLVLKVILDHENPKVQSVTSVWKSADWLERETYDLVGITFERHPNLVRILLPDGWVGHPLRKDYDMQKEQYVLISETGEDIVTPDPSKALRPGKY